MTTSAIWTDWSCRVRVAVTRPDSLTAAKQQVVALMADVALSADRFSPRSDVSRVNRAAGRLVPVRRRTMELLDVALAAADESNGAVDPTIGAHLLRAGYAEDITVVRDLLVVTDDDASLPRADWTSVRLDRTLLLAGLPTGVRLDLGATAKAWTADVAARHVARSLDTAVLVEIGGDVAVAGSRSRPWQVQVSERSGEPGQRVGLDHGGIATSSTISRRWRTTAGAAHHVIDPRTGRPADGPWRTVTVWAPTAVGANTASTAALVLGDDAVTHLRGLDVAARLVSRDGTVEHVGDWPGETRAA